MAKNPVRKVDPQGIAQDCDQVLDGDKEINLLLDRLCIPNEQRKAYVETLMGLVNQVFDDYLKEKFAK